MKTAVEWLIDELYKQGISLYTPELIEQAKEMFEKQIIMFGAQCMVEVEKESGLGAIKIYELTFKQQEQ